MESTVVLKTISFASPGPQNTEACLQAVKKRVDELNLSSVVLASCSGQTAFKALDLFDPQSVNLVAVTHVTGFRNVDEQEMSGSVREDLESRGVRVLTSAHAFGGVGRGVRQKLNTFQIDEIIAFTLRMFGQGVKVGIELSLMAADAGLIRTDQEAAVIGGTGSGADSALVVTPANSHRCLDLKVHEIIAKPRL
ncbi:MAG: hypothetical protein K9K64_09370 [Desulfohalobiaceae bacterium]|nr:hypothetical protein [Desulfohalobiaceae bacterium]